MSLIRMNINIDPFFYEEWKDKINSKVYSFFEELRDFNGIGGEVLKAFVYLMGEDIIIFLPLVNSLEKTNDDVFELLSVIDEDCGELENLVPYEFMDNELCLFTIPEDKMDTYVSDFLLLDFPNDKVEYDVPLCDVSISYIYIFFRIFKCSGYDNFLDDHESLLELWKNEQIAKKNILESYSKIEKNYPTKYLSFKYNVIIKEAFDELFNLKEGKKSLFNNDENNISQIFKFFLGDFMVFSDKLWWRCVNGIWEDNNSSYIWNIISGNLYEIYSHINIDVEYYEEKSGQIKNYLGSYLNRSRIVKDLERKLEKRNFSDQLDNDKYKIGFPNGVYNLEKMKLENVTSTDYISKKFGIEFSNEIDEKRYEGLNSILDKIFPNEDVKKFFIRSLGSLLEGDNIYKVFYIWYGPGGNNGKSVLQSFLLKLFGDYASTLSVSFVTTKRTSSAGATPDLMMLKNKRVIMMCEPNPGDKFQSGKIKELSGGDEVYTRKLYHDGSRMNIKVKLIIVTNSANDSLGRDIAYRSRIKVIPFRTVFTDTGKNEGRNCTTSYRKDYNIGQKLWLYRNEFLHMILEAYTEFMIYGLEVPKIIEDETNDYLAQNNSSFKYIKKYILPLEYNDVNVNYIYGCYKNNVTTFSPGIQIDNKELFVNELISSGYTIDNNVVKNCDVINEE